MYFIHTRLYSHLLRILDIMNLQISQSYYVNTKRCPIPGFPIRTSKTLYKSTIRHHNVILVRWFDCFCGTFRTLGYVSEPTTSEGTTNSWIDSVASCRQDIIAVCSSTSSVYRRHCPLSITFDPVLFFFYPVPCKPFVALVLFYYVSKILANSASCTQKMEQPTPQICNCINIPTDP